MRTRQLLDEVVESVSHTHILCNVTGVEDVLARGRDANLKFVKRFFSLVPIFFTLNILFL